MTPESKKQMDHRARKRAKGECVYGGCHDKAVARKNGMCSKHHAHDYERKAVAAVRRMTKTELLLARDRFKRALQRVVTEIGRREEKR